MNKSIVIPKSVLLLNPLIWSGQGNLMINFSHPNIFIGTGVATKNKLSVAIPFDSLGFLLSAEFIRQQIPGSHVFLLIADQHAWLANGISKTEVRKIASKQEKIFRQITSKFKLSNWHISKASGLFPHAIPDTYEKLETRDVSHFFHHRKTGVKIGWMFSAKENQHQTDEAHFDCNFDFNIKSIFTKPGVTLDPSKPLESPYICSNPSKRILLTKNENLTNKLDSGSTSENQRQAVQNQLKRITMLFERVVEPLPDKTSVEKKVKIILDKIFN